MCVWHCCSAGAHQRSRGILPRGCHRGAAAAEPAALPGTQEQQTPPQSDSSECDIAVIQSILADLEMGRLLLPAALATLQAEHPRRPPAHPPARPSAAAGPPPAPAHGAAVLVRNAACPLESDGMQHAVMLRPAWPGWGCVKRRCRLPGCFNTLALTQCWSPWLTLPPPWPQQRRPPSASGPPPLVALCSL